MIKFFLILRKIIIALAPLVLFYLLKKGDKESFRKKFSLSDFDKNKIVEGEIVEDGKSYEKSKKIR